MNDVFDVCDYVLFYENQQGRSVTNLRLQKLLYFIQATFLKELNVPCFEARMEAWAYGPVIPKVYRKYKGFGSDYIYIQFFGDLSQSESKLKKSKMISQVLESAKKFKTSQLIDISHGQQPWKDSFGTNNDEITLQSMRNYFC